MSVTIYHNPRCSKSRDTLALLQARGITPQVVAYLEQAPTPDEIQHLLCLLGLADARALMRKGEAEYTELGLDAPALGQDALIAAMAAHPRLIERPIVVHGDKAVIGRPPEKVLAIL
jgi:arsenate reductase